jgi:hypothetical protein
MPRSLPYPGTRDPMRRNPSQPEGQAPLREEALPQFEWRIRALFEEFLIVRQQDLQAEEIGTSVPGFGTPSA